MRKLEIRGNIMLNNMAHADKISSKLNIVVHYAELIKSSKPVSPDIQVDVFLSLFSASFPDDVTLYQADICWLG